jgi:hypothetical protein
LEAKKKESQQTLKKNKKTENIFYEIFCLNGQSELDHLTLNNWLDGKNETPIWFEELQVDNCKQYQKVKSIVNFNCFSHLNLKILLNKNSNIKSTNIFFF